MSESSQTSVVDSSDREIVLTRLIDAPRELVFQAWTDPQHLVHWWGPNGFTTTYHSFEPRPGGVCRFTMHGPDGTDYPNRIAFDRVVPPELLTYVHGSTEEQPDVFRVTVTFEELDGKTRITLRSLFPTAEARDLVVREHNALEGGKQTLARLDQYLASLRG